MEERTFKVLNSGDLKFTGMIKDTVGSREVIRWQARNSFGLSDRE